MPLMTARWSRLSGQAEDGRLPARGVGPDRAREQVEARFVDPDDGPPLLVSPLFRAGQRSVRQASIAASFRWLARVDRLLHAPAGRAQELADVIGMVAHPKLPPNDRRHALGGPDVTAKAERLGPLRQQHRHLRPLLRRQFRRRPRGDAPLQRLDSALAPTSHPLAHRPSRHPQRLGNRLLAPALRLQCPRPQPSPFAPLLRSSCFLCHTSAHRTARTTFSLLRGDQ